MTTNENAQINGLDNITIEAELANQIAMNETIEKKTLDVIELKRNEMIAAREVFAAEFEANKAKNKKEREANEAKFKNEVDTIMAIERDKFEIKE